MPNKKRTRPGKRAIESEPSSSGCCKPYPDAKFVDGCMVSLFSHHNGDYCKGMMEPMSIEEWDDEIDRRTSIGSRSRGDVR